MEKIEPAPDAGSIKIRVSFLTLNFQKGAFLTPLQTHHQSGFATKTLKMEKINCKFLIFFCFRLLLFFHLMLLTKRHCAVNKN
jgi:hypothetical protein